MTGNVLINGKKRRLDYGVLVSNLYTCTNMNVQEYRDTFESYHFSLVTLFFLFPLKISGLRDPRGYFVGNSNS